MNVYVQTDLVPKASCWLACSIYEKKNTREKFATHSKHVVEEDCTGRSSFAGWRHLPSLHCCLIPAKCKQSPCLCFALADCTKFVDKKRVLTTCDLHLFRLVIVVTGHSCLNVYNPTHHACPCEAVMVHNSHWRNTDK